MELFRYKVDKNKSPYEVFKEISEELFKINDMFEKYIDNRNCHVFVEISSVCNRYQLFICMGETQIEKVIPGTEIVITSCIEKENDYTNIHWLDVELSNKEGMQGRALSTIHSEYIKSEKWNEKRKEILKRDNYTCKLCSAKDTELHVHHNTYDNLGFEKDEDLITLCKECHEKFHNINNS